MVTLQRGKKGQRVSERQTTNGMLQANSVKKKRRAEARQPLVILRSGLEGLDVRGLQALRSFGDLEFNRLAVIQRLIAISHNRGEMYENIFCHSGAG